MWPLPTSGGGLTWVLGRLQRAKGYQREAIYCLQVTAASKQGSTSATDPGQCYALGAAGVAGKVGFMEMLPVFPVGAGLRGLTPGSSVGGLRKWRNTRVPRFPQWSRGETLWLV